jgi:hypothetical protein
MKLILYKDKDIRLNKINFEEKKIIFYLKIKYNRLENSLTWLYMKTKLQVHFFLTCKMKHTYSSIKYIR